MEEKEGEEKEGEKEEQEEDEEEEEEEMGKGGKCVRIRFCVMAGHA